MNSNLKTKPLLWFVVLLFLVFFTCSLLYSTENDYATSKGGIEYRITGISHLDTALSYIGVREKGANRGFWIERFLHSVKLGKGQPYCASFVSYCLTQCKSSFPIRSGLARSFKTRKSINALDVARGWKRIPAGSLVGWEKTGSIKGHIGFVLQDWSGRFGRTVEGNTTSGSKRFKGEGVWVRSQEIETLGIKRITFFTLIEG